MFIHLPFSAQRLINNGSSTNTPFELFFLFVSGHRANQIIEPIDKTNNRSIMGRMLGAVSNSVKIGTYVLDSVQQRTNDVIQSALH